MKQDKKVHHAIDAYYKTLQEFEFQHALHEGAVSVAFQTLLTEVGRRYHWTLIPQLQGSHRGNSIRPDGTLKDPMSLVRGHWEAKDTQDNLDAEISKKIKKGYPLGNIIFEDTRRAILYQNKTQVMNIDLRNPEQLARVLVRLTGMDRRVAASRMEAVYPARCTAMTSAFSTSVVRVTPDANSTLPRPAR